jgi:hypothetical protein
MGKPQLMLTLFPFFLGDAGQENGKLWEAVGITPWHIDTVPRIHEHLGKCSLYEKRCDEGAFLIDHPHRIFLGDVNVLVGYFWMP